MSALFEFCTMKSAEKKKPSAFSIQQPEAGMTLLEMLVAFAIFLALVATLVAFSTTSLETWRSGEERKDVYERAQALLDQIGEDLRSTFSENEWPSDGQNALQPAQFIGDIDENRNARLRWVRSGTSGCTGPSMPAAARRAPSGWYGDLYEVAYLLDRDPATATLHRGLRVFDRRAKNSLFDEDVLRSQKSPAFLQTFSPLDNGVLHLSFAFWAPFTNTWDRSHPVSRTPRGKREPVGPSLLWDSTRVELHPFFLRKPKELISADFVYPEMVMVTLILESSIPELRGAKLLDGTGETEGVLRVTSTRGMPPAPGSVRIDSEWIEYEEKGLTELRALRRGARSTSPAAHPRDAAVRFGETFEAVFRIPVFREAGR
jgi:type II secretory pathway pseudopilin PulG